VRPGGIGSSQYIKSEVEKLRCEVREFELEAQFRCAGSDAFVDWVNNTVGIQHTAHMISTQNVGVRKTHFASYTILPPATVRMTLVASNFSGDAALTSRSRTTKSASIPATSLPFSFSSNSANAGPVV
jgi:hypothetical protein